MIRHRLKIYLAYIGGFWQKAIFSNRLHNLLLVPQSTLQAFLLQCLLKENLKVIRVFKVLTSPSRSTGITFVFISLGKGVVVVLNCTPPCAGETEWELFSFTEKLNIDFSKWCSVSKHFLKKSKSFHSLMLQQKALSNMSAHSGGYSLTFPCFKKYSILLHPCSF